MIQNLIDFWGEPDSTRFVVAGLVAAAGLAVAIEGNRHSVNGQIVFGAAIALASVLFIPWLLS